MPKGLQTLVALVLLSLLACQSGRRREGQAPAGGTSQATAEPTSANSIITISGVQNHHDSTTVLVLSNGQRFKTTLFEAKVLGQLRTTRKMPYFILAGRGCTDCDANISIYIHSPSDGPMRDEATQLRFNYPGREKSYEDETPLFEGRLFFGDCLPQYSNAAIWFQRNWGDDKRWHKSVYVVQAQDDSLVTTSLRKDLPQASLAVAAVAAHRCAEVPGEERSSEP